MKIAMCGATGRAGSRILDELLARGHHVLALVRSPETLPANPGLEMKADDLSDSARTAKLMHGADALVSAYGAPTADPEELVRVTARLIDAVEQSGVPRFLMVGGAGSLEVAPGLMLVDSGKLPAEWMPIANSHTRALKLLRSSSINWTSLSPAAFFDPGERTGHFRLGADELIVDSTGQSRISMEDYAIAVADELENPRHQRARFSIGY